MLAVALWDESEEFDPNNDLACRAVLARVEEMQKVE